MKKISIDAVSDEKVILSANYNSTGIVVTDGIR